MSVVDIQRRDAVAQRNHERITSCRAQSTSQRVLRSVTKLVNSNLNLTDLPKLLVDTEKKSPGNENDSLHLKNHDLANGRYFDESSILYPSLTEHDASIYASKPNRPSAEPSERLQGNSGVATVASDGTTPSQSQQVSSFESMNVSKLETDASTSQDVDASSTVPVTYSQKASREPDSPGVVPDDVAPPQPDEEAEFDGATQQLLDRQHPQKPAKVVHLPPEGVQEARLAEEHRRKKSEDTESTKASRTQTQAELASSPSSTVGAYSAATPMPPQDSPDTSPDSENGESIEVLPPKDLRPSPEEQREKEEHDRLLEAQKEIARQQALGDVSDPDAQLRFEEREAAAREAEEKAARGEANGPEPDAKDISDETMAEEVVDEARQDSTTKPDDNIPSNQDSKAQTASSIDSQRLEPPADDDDNITVTPRNRAALTIDTSMQHSTDSLPQPNTSEQERMTTRTSSGALQKRSVSDILGQTPTQGDPRRIALSPETLSPMTLRHPHETPTTATQATFTLARPNSPRRASRQPGPPRTPNNTQTVLDELATLKGAAEDPDRDYLEPLFRIQAHDSPNVQTKPLNELLRTASKTLTTEDHYRSIHERLDYRILRRIYQLQNANKWSLRQMERAAEVPQPVSHMDHMMAEMKWMRKDFRAERKMKLNVCAWLARRCAEWVEADPQQRRELQVKVKPQVRPEVNDSVQMTEDSAEPELEHSGESAPEDETGPPTPKNESSMPSTLIVAPDLSYAVSELQKSGKLHKALVALPKASFTEAKVKNSLPAPGQDDPAKKVLSQASKFSDAKVLPKFQTCGKKRSRFDYEDEDEDIEDARSSKRLLLEKDLPPEDQEMALFNPENKPIRDRLHANNAFRPPSEHAMPATQFYEFRSGSQWIWEDDQKLRKLAKEYSFNWSLIADELQLPALHKSSAERRTPWECFERWVELEQLPAEMRKTMYFKTWFQRLEQSQKAAEERYQRQVAALQQQSGGHAQHVPLRRRTMPLRVDKRRNSRYLWLVDAMRKGARKKEQAAFKQAESQRAAAQRKTQTDNNQPRAPMMTPQEFSKKRYDHDMKQLEMLRAQRQKVLEAQRKQFEAARMAAQQSQMQQNGTAGANPNQQQRPPNGQPNGQMQSANGQQAPNLPNGQYPQQGTNVNGQHQLSQQQLQQQQGQRQQQVPMATNNGHLAVPQVHMRGPAAQAQMRTPSMNAQVPDPAQMQRYAQQQAQAQARMQQQQQYPGQQGYGVMQSPNGGVGMSAHQTMQSSQAMMAANMKQMNQGQQQGNNVNQAASMSPSMPPPPTPQQNANGGGGTLSSGHTPILHTVRAQFKKSYPTYTDEQILQMATQWLKDQSQSLTTQARQNAMNAAAGINNAGNANNMQAYGYNQNMAYQNAGGQVVGNGYGTDGMPAQTGGMSPQQYANLMRQNQGAQIGRLQGSPAGSHASLNMNGSPSMANASPNTTNMTPVSPNMQYNQMAGMNMAGMQQRPPSRSATGTPQQRPSSSVGVPNMGQGMGSPGSANGMMQGSPGRVQATMAR